MNADKRHVIGIDLGGTFVKSGVVSARGEVLSKVSVDTRVSGGADAVIESVSSAAKLARQGAKLDWKDISTLKILRNIRGHCSTHKRNC